VSETIYKLSAHRTMSLRGFDRRGCAAALHDANATGFTVSGCWSDLADFAVAVLFDADDQYAAGGDPGADRASDRRGERDREANDMNRKLERLGHAVPR